MSEHAICIHCKKPETAAQFGLHGLGEGRRAGKLAQARRNAAAASTPTSLPSKDVRAWPLAAD